jgi:hypothetical protein
MSGNKIRSHVWQHAYSPQCVVNTTHVDFKGVPPSIRVFDVKGYAGRKWIGSSFVAKATHGQRHWWLSQRLQRLCLSSQNEKVSRGQRHRRLARPERPRGQPTPEHPRRTSEFHRLSRPVSFSRDQESPRMHQHEHRPVRSPRRYHAKPPLSKRPCRDMSWQRSAAVGRWQGIC